MTTLNKDGRPRNGGKIRADYLTEVEAHWVPALDERGVDGLRSLFQELGVSSGIAASLTFFVSDHRDLRPDGLDSATRSGYRRRLRKLASTPITPVTGGPDETPIMIDRAGMQAAA
jgi:hypothetical protein